jgi:hypothetical protein
MLTSDYNGVVPAVWLGTADKATVRGTNAVINVFLMIELLINYGVTVRDHTHSGRVVAQLPCTIIERGAKQQWGWGWITAAMVMGQVQQ